MPTRHAAGMIGDLVDGNRCCELTRDQRMAHLVMGDDVALLFAQHPAPLLEAGTDRSMASSKSAISTAFLSLGRPAMRLVDDVARSRRRSRGCGRR